MKALVVLAHGSRIQKSNEEVEAFAKQLASLTDGYQYVEHCFLELTKPGFSETLGSLAKKSVTAITVYPHFLAQGRHVRDDVPMVIGQFRDAHPEISVDLKSHLGDWGGLAEFVAKGL